MSERQDQADRILALLKRNQPFPTRLPEIMALGIASHTRRVSDLRAKGFDIRMISEWHGRVRKVWYELKSEPENAVNS